MMENGGYDKSSRMVEGEGTMSDLERFFGKNLFSNSKKDQSAKRSAQRLLDSFVQLNQRLELWITKGKFKFVLSLITYDPDYLLMYGDYDVVGFVTTNSIVEEIQAWRVRFLFHEREKAFEQLFCIANSRNQTLGIESSQYGMKGWRSNYNIRLEDRT